jgi:hypothetical protein
MAELTRPCSVCGCTSWPCVCPKAKRESWILESAGLFVFRLGRQRQRARLDGRGREAPMGGRRARDAMWGSPSELRTRRPPEFEGRHDVHQSRIQAAGPTQCEPSQDTRAWRGQLRVLPIRLDNTAVRVGLPCEGVRDRTEQHVRVELHQLKRAHHQQLDARLLEVPEDGADDRLAARRLDPPHDVEPRDCRRDLDALGLPEAVHTRTEHRAASCGAGWGKRGKLSGKLGQAGQAVEQAGASSGASWGKLGKLWSKLGQAGQAVGQAGASWASWIAARGPTARSTSRAFFRVRSLFAVRAELALSDRAVRLVGPVGCGGDVQHREGVSGLAEAQRRVEGGLGHVRGVDAHGDVQRDARGAPARRGTFRRGGRSEAGSASPSAAAE